VYGGIPVIVPEFLDFLWIDFQGAQQGGPVGTITNNQTWEIIPGL